MEDKKQLNEEKLEKVNGGGVGLFKICPGCGEAKSYLYVYCPDCKTDLVKVPSQQLKVCPHCSTPNALVKSICIKCFQPLDTI